MTQEKYLEQIIKQGAEIKDRIKYDTENLRNINAEIEKLTDFSGKKSASLTAAGITVKIQKRDNVKWDQDKLHQFRDAVGDELFFDLFKVNFKPLNGKVNAYVDTNGKHSQGIEWCRTVAPGTPTVTYTPLEEN